MQYEIYQTKELKKKLKKIKNPHINRIIKRISKLSTDPYHEGKRLKGGNVKGLRSHREGDIRIIYSICEECRINNFNEIRNCVDCESLPTNALKVFDADFRKDVYEKF